MIDWKAVSTLLEGFTGYLRHKNQKEHTERVTEYHNYYQRLTKDTYDLAKVVEQHIVKEPMFKMENKELMKAEHDYFLKIKSNEYFSNVPKFMEQIDIYDEAERKMQKVAMEDNPDEYYLAFRTMVAARYKLIQVFFEKLCDLIIKLGKENDFSEEQKYLYQHHLDILKNYINKETELYEGLRQNFEEQMQSSEN